MADTKGVNMITADRGDLMPRSFFAQLHITVEKTVQYDLDDDSGSGPSDQNSPAMYPMTPTNVHV